MSNTGNTVTVEVPNIGDFRDVEIIEVLVSVGDTVQKEAPLLTLETDKAALDIPCPRDGSVEEVLIKGGDTISQGDPIMVLSVGGADNPPPPKPQQSPRQQPRAAVTDETPLAAAETTQPAAAGGTQSAADPGQADLNAEVVVLGSGPGGYTAAFRAADLGRQVVLIERYQKIGGVCLNVGCIPSKTLLHTAQIITEVAAMSDQGVVFAAPKIDLAKLAKHKNRVTDKLTGGLGVLAKQRKVKIITGVGKITSPRTIEVTSGDNTTTIRFEHLIIAAGSQAVRLPGLPNDDPRLMDSTAALELAAIPPRLLIIGGGIIGLEMAAVYHALGAKITVVELSPELIPGCDRDLVRPLEKRIRAAYENICTATRVTAVKAVKAGLKVSFSGETAPAADTFDRVLVAVGRRPNGADIGAQAAGVRVDEHGFIPVDNAQQTNVERIFAIGDITGPPMLAHKATHEGKVAAEVISGMKTRFDARAIPSVAYTDPEVAWMGLTEARAKADKIEYHKGVFPWAASGRALSVDRAEGMTKLLFDKRDGRLLGAGVVGVNAGELIAETVLALEMGANAEDIGLSIHPHPTLSESVNFAAEAAAGTITDLYLPKK